MNGLSSLGAGVAAFAGTAGLEAQKAQLANQSAILADQLATTRETALEGQRQTFQTGLEGQRQTFQTGLQAQEQAAAAARQQAQLGVTQSEGAATRAAELARTKMTLEAPSPEIKSAKQFATLTPEEKQAYREEMMTKAGLPPWMIGTGGDNPAPPPTGTGSASDIPPAPADTTASTPASNITGAPVTPAAALDPAARPAGGARNDKALEGVPTGAASVIKGMVDGRISPPTSFAMSKPYWQAMIAKAADYDPTFDQTTWAGRIATRKAFSPDGQAGKGMGAINTALNHAGTLAGDFDALDNWSFTPFNTVKNYIEPMFGDSRQNKAEEARDALAAEARKVFSATGGGNLTELQEWQKNFPINGSPAQQKAALTGFVELLDGRLQTLADQYNQGMRRTDDPVTLLKPKARAVYEKLTGNAPSNATGYQTGYPPDTGTAAPAAAAVPPPAKPGSLANAPMGGLYGGTVTPSPAANPALLKLWGQ